MWCILELNLSILGGSIPTVKPFIRQVFPNLLGTSKGASKGARSDDMYLQFSSAARKRASRGLGSTPGVKSTYSGHVSAAMPSVQGSQEHIVPSRTESMGRKSGTRTRENETMIFKTVEYGYEVESVRDSV
jgi:hypothetical protein